MVTRTDGPRTTERPSPADRRAARSKRGSETWRALRAAWQRIERGVPELKDDVVCFAKTRADLARLAARQAIRRVVSRIAAGVVAIAVVVTALALVIDGVAGGLTVALDGRTWLANLITGAGVLGVVAVAVGIRSRSQTALRLRRLEERYRRHDARQRATEARGTP